MSKEEVKIGSWVEQEPEADILDDNPDVHRVGDNCIFIDGVSMSFKVTAFYKDIVQNRILWTRTTPSLHHYFIGGGKICGTRAAINVIKSEELLCSDFKRDCLRTVSIHRRPYNQYSTLMVEQKKNSEWFMNTTCVDKMVICKEIGNEIYKAGGLSSAAITLYCYGVCGLGEDDAAKHSHCKGTDGHDVVLAQLYNNIATVYHVQLNNLIAAKHFSQKALQWKPDYKKALDRLKIIDDMSK